MQDKKYIYFFDLIKGVFGMGTTEIKEKGDLIKVHYNDGKQKNTSIVSAMNDVFLNTGINITPVGKGSQLYADGFKFIVKFSNGEVREKSFRDALCTVALISMAKV